MVGPGEGLGDGLGAGDPSGDGDGAGEPLGVGLGLELGLGLGFCSGGIAGLSAGVTVTGVGFAAGTFAGVCDVVRALVFLRLFFVVGVAGAVISAGVGPAAAGLATSVPTAAGIVLFVRRLAIVRPVEKEQGCAASTDVNVSRLPLLRPRSEITAGVVALPSPI